MQKLPYACSIHHLQELLSASRCGPKGDFGAKFASNKGFSGEFRELSPGLTTLLSLGFLYNILREK